MRRTRGQGGPVVLVVIHRCAVAEELHTVTTIQTPDLRVPRRSYSPPRVPRPRRSSTFVIEIQDASPIRSLIVSVRYQRLIMPGRRVRDRRHDATRGATLLPLGADLEPGSVPSGMKRVVAAACFAASFVGSACDREKAATGCNPGQATDVGEVIDEWRTLVDGVTGTHVQSNLWTTPASRRHHRGALLAAGRIRDRRILDQPP